jgi:hypothetical protein
LHITAKREQAEALGTVYYRHRPLKIDKKVLWTILINEEEEEEEEKVKGKATYENGIVTLKIPIPNRQTFR